MNSISLRARVFEEEKALIVSKKNAELLVE